MDEMHVGLEGRQISRVNEVALRSWYAELAVRGTEIIEVRDLPGVVQLIIHDNVNVVEAVLTSPIRRTQSIRVSAAPGQRLWKVTEFLCSKKTYASVFAPLLAEFQHEYFEALNDGRQWKARWLRVVYVCAFLKSAGLHISMKLLREAWSFVVRRG